MGRTFAEKFQTRPNMTQSNIEDRLLTLERTVAELVGKQDSPKPKGDWRSTIGMFAGDPVIREIQEEGRRIREAERDAAQKDTLP
jgi:hypothetical protein